MGSPSDWAAPGEDPKPADQRPDGRGGRPGPAPGSGPPGYPPPPYGPPPYGGSGPPSAPKPGVIPLRPLGVGEILDGAVSYIRANPRVTLGISAVVITVIQLIQLATQLWFLSDLAGLDSLRGNPSDEAVAQLVGGGTVAMLVSVVLALIGATMLNGLLIVVLGRAVLGQQVSAREAWAAARPRLPGLVGLSLLLLGILFAVFVVLSLPAAAAFAAGATGLGAGLTVIGVLAGIVLSVYLFVTFALAAPAYMLERTGVVAALGRSRRLVRTRWWPIFGILLLAAVLAGLIGAIIAIPFSYLGGFTGVALGLDESMFSATSSVALAVTAVGTIVAGTITAPFQAGVAGLLYFDQRMRREGLDIELARSTGGIPGPPPAPPPGQAW